jgi:hypothetical protein
MLERDIERYLCKQIKDLGGQTRKLTYLGHAGAPDRLVIMPQIGVFFVELKADRAGAKLSALQVRELDLLRSAQAQVSVLRSISDVNIFIKNFKKNG